MNTKRIIYRVTIKLGYRASCYDFNDLLLASAFMDMASRHAVKDESKVDDLNIPEIYMQVIEEEIEVEDKKEEEAEESKEEE